TPAGTTSPLGNLRGLVGQVRQGLALSEKRRALAEAQRHATDSAAQLATERQQIAAELAASKQSVPELAARRARGAGSVTAPAAPAKPAAPLKAPAATPAAPPPAAGAAAALAAGAASGDSGAAPTLLSLTRQIAAEQ